MALKPEFISLLRDIRDRIYPECNTKYNEIGVIYADTKVIEANIVLMYTDIQQIRASIHAITIGTVTTINVNPDGSHGNASASYDALTSTLNFGIPVGDTGVKGDPGIDGIDGLAGDQGPMGLTGPQGAAGLGTDVQGSATVTTITGKDPSTVGIAWIATTVGLDDDGLSVEVDDVLRATGTKWVNIGPIQGPAGDQGIQGMQGVAGPTGPIGLNGEIGSTGNKGDTGLTGAQGAIGDTGIQGIQGEIGPEGPIGVPGPDGTYELFEDGDGRGKAYKFSSGLLINTMSSLQMTFQNNNQMFADWTYLVPFLDANIGVNASYKSSSASNILVGVQVENSNATYVRVNIFSDNKWSTGAYGFTIVTAIGRWK